MLCYSSRFERTRTPQSSSMFGYVAKRFHLNQNVQCSKIARAGREHLSLYMQTRWHFHKLIEIHHIASKLLVLHSIDGRLKTKVMSRAEDTALPGLDSVHEVQNYLSVQLLSRTGTHILGDVAVNIQVLRRTALAIQSFAVRELSSHGPWVMTKCQAA